MKTIQIATTIIVLLFASLISCENKVYTANLPKSKVILKLYSNQGIESIDTFIINNTDISSLVCRADGNIFDKGYYNLHCFKTYNSWSGSTITLKTNVADFKILKIEPLQ